MSPAIDPTGPGVIDLTGSAEPGTDLVVPGNAPPLPTTSLNGSVPLHVAWVSNGQHNKMMQLPDLVKESTRAIKIVVPAVEPTHSSSPESESDTDSDYEPGGEFESDTDSDYEPGGESESDIDSESGREHDINADLKRKTDDRYSLDDGYDYTHTLDDVSSHRKGKTITASDVGLYQDIRGRQRVGKQF
jgi:hypothetical protein